jgi:hypothetical protein
MPYDTEAAQEVATALREENHKGYEALKEKQGLTAGEDAMVGLFVSAILDALQPHITIIPDVDLGIAMVERVVFVLNALVEEFRAGEAAGHGIGDPDVKEEKDAE